jgi:hypothetical protein
MVILGIVLVIAALVLITACRLLGNAIREVNIWDRRASSDRFYQRK